MSLKVFVTRRLPQPALDMIAERYEMTLNEEDRVLDRGEVIEGVRTHDALLCLLTDPIDAEIMDANPDLRVISNYAVGFNNVDVAAATERGIPVCNTPGVLNDTTADLSFALLMSIARRVVESDRYARAGHFKGWGPMLFLGQDVHGATLGVVGAGRIGYAMALRGYHGFGMSVLYADPKPNERLERETGARRVELDELLGESDFVSVHVPLMETTRHLINYEKMCLMKPSACLINTSRGPVVNEAELARALREERIFGAGLDVFEEEPVIHPDLMEIENVILAPHIASASIATRTKMATMAAENLIAIIEGTEPHSIVNPEVLS
jgi:lactate dehydrogenase-like 2-hydroxyacid dehydrogenase